MSNYNYRIKQGDSLIKIARMFGLNSIDELVHLNNIADPNRINAGDILVLPENASIPTLRMSPSTITASAPDYTSTDYANLPESVRAKVDAYAQAIKDHKITINQVPPLYRQQAYKQTVRGTMDEAGSQVADKVLMFPFKMVDVPVRATLNEGRKLIFPQQNDYGVGDYFGHFSFMGPEFEQEHPVADAVLNIGTTPLITSVGSKVAMTPRALQTISSNVRNNARATGETVMGHMSAPKPTSGIPVSNGTVYQSGTKGFGKTGTVTRGQHGYRPNTSSKGTSSHQSFYMKGQDWQTVNPEFTYTPLAKGLVLPSSTSPAASVPVPYRIQEQEPTHIEHVEPANPWIYNTTPTAVVPYKVGIEEPVYYELEAPVGNSIEEQPIMVDTAKKKKGSAAKSAKEVSGNVMGVVPSDTYFSAYGFGNPVIVTRKRGGFLPRR